MRLTVDHVAVDRGSRRILDDVSFVVEAGRAVILTGPNGSGKTTLLRAIAGFMPVASGAIRLDGVEDEATVGEKAHFVGHRDGIKAAMSVRENADFLARYLGGPLDGVPEALDALGIGALNDVPAAWLSAGQRRRLGLSRLLVAHRPLWLLDEPTVSLDASAVATLAVIIGRHLADGGIVVAATHLPLGLEAAREVRLGGGRGRATGSGQGLEVPS